MGKKYDFSRISTEDLETAKDYQDGEIYCFRISCQDCPFNKNSKCAGNKKIGQLFNEELERRKQLEKKVRDKCQWKDGVFKGCNVILCKIEGNDPDFLKDHKYKLSLNDEDYTWTFCPYCGADIHKPKPEPIIKKSGDTCVARFKGIDYLWTAQSKLNIDHEIGLIKETGLFSNSWKPISEIEITDTIARLWPMVKFKTSKNMRVYPCYAVKDNEILIDIDGVPDWYLAKVICLAIVSDLKDSE